MTCINHSFCYRYFLTDQHSTPCGCKSCEIIAYFNSEAWFTSLSNLIGQVIGSSYSISASKYTEGCFLATHTDSPNGDMAFVYNLSKNWNPVWGGLLHFLELDLKTIKKVVHPEFNSLVLFNVANGDMPHYVSSVSQGVTAKRLAVSGWFKHI